MIKRMRDWKIPVVQTVVLCVVAIVLCTMDVNAIVMGILQYASIEINELPVECRLAISFGPRVLSGIIWLAFLWVIRRFNAIDILNKGSDYHDHYYVSYCFCRYVLGYKKCCLTRVPIYMQFKLVLADLFPEYLYTDGIHELESDMISVVRSGECNDTVNLIMAAEATSCAKEEEEVKRRINRITFSDQRLNPSEILQMMDAFSLRAAR